MPIPAHSIKAIEIQNPVNGRKKTVNGENQGYVKCN